VRDGSGPRVYPKVGPNVKSTTKQEHALLIIRVYMRLSHTIQFFLRLRTAGVHAVRDSGGPRVALGARPDVLLDQAGGGDSARQKGAGVIYIYYMYIQI